MDKNIKQGLWVCLGVGLYFVMAISLSMWLSSSNVLDSRALEKHPVEAVSLANLLAHWIFW